ncbi:MULTISPECIES: hypothetical protein [unclassified Streptomyces]|uniref:TRAFAC clade GTPase domain-containing protein n=1 Tax=unclassified Streptomyces TaxID=2593676 RepID=UPI00380CF04C
MRAIPVTVLGPHKSGKTVYLASLFRRLALQRDDIGFFVQLPSDQGQRLNNVYNEIVSPGAWPDPTLLSDVSEWEFTCAIRTHADKVFRPFAITYMDFAGEHLTSGKRTEAHARVWKRVEESEFLLVLLDGAKVLRCFEGDYRVVDELVQVFNVVAGSKAVVHFVVTKWDLLQTAGHTVRSVMDQLMKHPDFHDCVETRLRQSDTSGRLRVIPVSSVGAGFAVPDGEAMVKQGGFPRPLNVEVPLMAVLVDLFDRHLNEMAAEGSVAEGAAQEQRQAQKLKWIRTIQGQLPVVKALLGARAVKTPALKVLQETMLGPFMDFVGRQVDEYGQRVEHDVAALRAEALQARSEQEALSRLIHLFEAALAEFEIGHPGSRLRKEAA